jgi:hypothetical protein
VATAAGELQAWGVGRSVLERAALLVAAALAPALIGGLLFGVGVAVGVVLGLGVGLAAGALCDVRTAVVVILVNAAAALAGSLVAGSPLGAAAVVGVAGLVVGPANRLGIGRTLMVAPVIAAVMASGTLAFPPGATAGGLVIGAAWTFVLVRALKGRQEPQPLAPVDAWIHAVTLAATCAAATYVAVAVPLDHGYWIVVTLAAVLVPVASETSRANVERTIGTLLGAFIGVAAGVLVPPWLVVTAIYGSAVLFVAYAMVKDSIRRTALLTVMLVLALAGASPESSVDIAIARLVWTVVAAGIVTVVSIVVNAAVATAGHRTVGIGDPT